MSYKPAANHYTHPLPDGYKVFQGKHAPVHHVLRHMGHSFKRFQQSWQTLAPDHYLRDGGHYRLRRYSVFHWQQGELITLPHEPHFQGKHFNHLHGGIKRDYKDWARPIQNNAAFQATAAWAISQLSKKSPYGWRIQGHQFRILAKPDEQGKPTPEGMHKDGADFILIMLLNKKNVKGGVSRIYTNEKQLMQSLTLEQAGDTIIMDDTAVWHDVSPIERDNTQQEAYRDVLVLTFHSLTSQHKH